jgi:hypothetical protein
MTRMDATTRTRWMAGKVNVEASEHQCDRCDAPAVMIGHRGAGTTPHLFCADHFRADLAAERATRPSREELFARVTR